MISTVKWAHVASGALPARAPVSLVTWLVFVQELEAQEEEEDGTCPVDCVQGVRNLAEFQKVLDTAEENDDLVSSRATAEHR